MASVARARAGDVVKCSKNGETFWAEVTANPEKVSPRVFELPVRVIGGGHWQRGRRYSRVRGRQVETLYRALKA